MADSRRVSGGGEAPTRHWEVKKSKVASFNLFLFFSAIGRDLRVRVSIGFDFWAILTK